MFTAAGPILADVPAQELATDPSSPYLAAVTSASSPSNSFVPLGPSLSHTSADLSRSLSQTSSQLGASPKSPSPSNGSSSSASKKILGSTALAGLLRRKKSSLEDHEKSRRAKEDKAAQKEEAKALKKIKEEEKKREAKEKKAPTPVSSVKKRVEEIEAEAALRDGQPPASPTSVKRLSTFASSNSLRSIGSKALPVSTLALPSSPLQEAVHHDAKEPTSLSQLPSPLPTPMPASPSKGMPLAAEDDPFLVDSTPASPSTAPVFAPTPPAQPAESTATGEGHTNPTSQNVALPILGNLGTSPAKMTTPALESAEEGHSTFVERERESAVDQSEERDRREASEASTVREEGGVEQPCSSPVDEAPSPAIEPPVPPRPATPPTPPSTDRGLYSLSTPVKADEPSQSTPRATEVARFESSNESSTPSRTLATPPQSDSPGLRTSVSNNSMATSFATAASEAGSVSTAGSTPQWEQAETELRL